MYTEAPEVPNACCAHFGKTLILSLHSFVLWKNAITLKRFREINPLVTEKMLSRYMQK